MSTGSTVAQHGDGEQEPERDEADVAGPGAGAGAGLHVGGDFSAVADRGSVAAGAIHGPVTINNHHPAPGPAPVPPVRVGAVPPLATAFQTRADLRERIDRARERHGTVVLTQVLAGGGGVGKSQLAASYAHQAHTEGVEVLVWVDAADTSRVITAYAQAAAKVGAPGAGGEDAEADAAAFLEWLSVTDRTWLIVLDDLTDIENTGPWWPRTPAAGRIGRVLATTRRRDALLSGAGRTLIDIGLYSREEALDYLRERLDAADAAHLLDEHASDLVEALGRLPLALAHAAAYMINEDATTSAYLHRFTDRDQANRLDTLMPKDTDGDAYGRPVSASLLLALDAAQHREPAGLAVPAIRLAALLDPAGHPSSLWTTHAATTYLNTHRDPPSSETAERSAVTADQALAALRLLHRYGLLTSDSRHGHRQVRIHAITARAARETTPGPDVPATARAAADALLATWPEHTHENPDLTAVLRANTDTLHTHARNHLWQPGGHLVLYKAGASLNDAGLYNAAIDHWRQVVADAESHLRDQHPDTLNARHNLAASYQQAGRTTEAITMQERVVADIERVLGDQHPDTLTTRHNLASSYRQAGRTDKAIDLQEQVAADRARVLGDQHPHTLNARHNLAASYWQAGRTTEAITMQERVVADSEHVLGAQHPDTLTTRHNLAASYQQAGRTAEAIALLERVVADRERVLGHDHPDTLAARKNLAIAYRQAGAG